MFFLMLLWTPLAYIMNSTVDIFNDATPSTFLNQSVNKSELAAEYEYGYSVVYVSLFFIVFVIFLYVVKLAVQQKERRWPHG